MSIQWKIPAPFSFLTVRNFFITDPTVLVTLSFQSMIESEHLGAFQKLKELSMKVYIVTSFPLFPRKIIRHFIVKSFLNVPKCILHLSDGQLTWTSHPVKLIQINSSYAIMWQSADREDFSLCAGCYNPRGREVKVAECAKWTPNLCGECDPALNRTGGV